MAVSLPMHAYSPVSVSGPHWDIHKSDLSEAQFHAIPTGAMSQGGSWNIPVKGSILPMRELKYGCWCSMNTEKHPKKSSSP